MPEDRYIVSEEEELTSPLTSVEDLLDSYVTLMLLGQALSRLGEEQGEVEKQRGVWSPLAEPGKYVPVKRQVVRGGKVFEQTFYRLAEQPQPLGRELAQHLVAIADLATESLRSIAGAQRARAKAYEEEMQAAVAELESTYGMAGKVGELLKALWEGRRRSLSEEEKGLLESLADSLGKRVKERTKPAEESLSTLLRYYGGAISLALLAQAVRDPRAKGKAEEALFYLPMAAEAITTLRGEAMRIAREGFRGSPFFDENGESTLEGRLKLANYAWSLSRVFVNLPEVVAESCPQAWRKRLKEFLREREKSGEVELRGLISEAVFGEAVRISLLCPPELDPRTPEQREEQRKSYEKTKEKVDGMVEKLKEKVQTAHKWFLEGLLKPPFGGQLPKKHAEAIQAFLDTADGLRGYLSERRQSAKGQLARSLEGIQKRVEDTIQRGCIGFALHTILGGWAGVPKGVSVLRDTAHTLHSIRTYVEEAEKAGTPVTARDVDDMVTGASERKVAHQRTVNYLKGLGLSKNAAETFANYVHRGLKYEGVASWLEKRADTLKRAFAGEKVPDDEVVHAIMDVYTFGGTLGY